MMILQVYKTTDCYRIILHNLAAIEKIYPVKFAEYFKEALGKTAQKEFLPGELLLTGLPMQPGDVPRTEADVADLLKIWTIRGGQGNPVSRIAEGG
ncbi:MAG: hypothetical protein ACQESQ_04945 [Bacteroidota bacterium]